MTRNKSRSGAVARAIMRQNKAAAAERATMEAEDFDLGRGDAPPPTDTAPPIAPPPASLPRLSWQQPATEPDDDAIEAASVPLPPSPSPAIASPPSSSLLPPPLTLTPLLLRKLSSCASSISCLTTSSATYSPRSWMDASSPCSVTDDEKAGGLTRCLTSDSGRTARLLDRTQSLSTEEDTVGSPRILSQSTVFTSTSTLTEALDAEGEGEGDGDAQEAQGGPQGGPLAGGGATTVEEAGPQAQAGGGAIEGAASQGTSTPPPPQPRDHPLRRAPHPRRPSRNGHDNGYNNGPPPPPPATTHERHPSWQHEGYAYAYPPQPVAAGEEAMGMGPYAYYPAAPVYYAEPPPVVYAHGDTHYYGPPSYPYPYYQYSYGYDTHTEGYLCPPVAYAGPMLLPAIDHIRPADPYGDSACALHPTTGELLHFARPEWYTGPMLYHTNYVHTPQGSFHKDEYYARQQHGAPVGPSVGPPQGPSQATQAEEGSGNGNGNGNGRPSEGRRRRAPAATTRTATATPS